MANYLGFVNQVNKDSLFTDLSSRKPSSKPNVLGQSDFIKLFVEQLKRQDPLEPLKDKEFISQISQFSSLEQVVQLNNKLQLLIDKNSDSGLFNLLGKRISWLDEKLNRVRKGVVSSLEKSGDQFTIKVDDRILVDQKTILSIERG